MRFLTAFLATTAPALAAPSAALPPLEAQGFTLAAAAFAAAVAFTLFAALRPAWVRA